MPAARLPAARRWLTVAAAGTAVAVFAGCASGTGAAAPTWVPQPAYTLEPNPVEPGAGASGAPSAPPTAPSDPVPSAPSSSPTGADPAVVATGLTAPVGIAVLPDGTALVGERTTGRILRVQPSAGKLVTLVRTIPGLDVAGDGGLLDLAVSPAYDQDGLIYAYVTTATDNRVIDFTLTGPVTPVLTGIPKGATGNGGRIAFGADGSLLVGTGDAGQPALAQQSTSLAGKVLEVNDVGQPVGAGSPVFNSGHRDIAGLCVDPNTAAIFSAEQAASGGSDKVELLLPGADYGWPAARPNVQAPIATLPVAESSVGGCAVADAVYYVVSLTGKELLAADITRTTTTVKLGPFTPSLTGTYGRLITVVAAPDGSLWLATSNKDGQGSPVPADERILHINPLGGGAGSQL